MTDKPMKPLLMCGPMVRAYMAGLKWCTRRVVVPQPEQDGDRFWWHGDWDTHGGPRAGVCTYGKPGNGEPTWTLKEIAEHARYQPGDLCYIRERQRVIEVRRHHLIRVRYEADGAESDWIEYPERCKWKPIVGKCLPYGGIRETARLFPPITDTRAERLWDITEEDAIAEGVAEGEWYDYVKHQQIGGVALPYGIFETTFMCLWDSLNAARGYPFYSNPCVFRYGLGKEKG